MNGADKRDKEEFRENLRKEFGFTEEQLLREMQEAEAASVDDSMFDGVEDRMFQKLMERKAEDEKREAQGKEAGKAAEQTAGPETKRVVRFGKRKVVLSVALVAAFALALGTTAIGGKSYFFRNREKEKGIVFNNDKYVSDVGNLAEAYEEIKKKLDIQVLSLKYIPEGMHFQELSINENRATIIFEYQNSNLYFVQEQQGTGTSIFVDSDRLREEPVYNAWLKQEIIIKQGELSKGQLENEIKLYIDDNFYSLTGKMEEDEFKKIVEFLNFY